MKKELNFKLNKTKKQKEKIMTLEVISKGKDIFNNFVFIVSFNKNLYQLKGWGHNKFGLKKIIDINKVNLSKPQDIDIMNMTNNTQNGTILNYNNI